MQKSNKVELIPGMNDMISKIRELKKMIPDLCDSLQKAEHESDIEVMRSKAFRRDNPLAIAKQEYCKYAKALLWQITDLRITSITETGEAIEKQRRFDEDNK